MIQDFHGYHTGALDDITGTHCNKGCVIISVYLSIVIFSSLKIIYLKFAAGSFANQGRLSDSG